MSEDDLVAILDAHETQRVHYRGCEMHSAACAVYKLVAEVRNLRAELGRIRDMTGQVKHTAVEACHGCGCVSLTAEEAVIYALRELRAEMAEQKAVNLQLAERLAACAAVLGRAAERGRVCEYQQTPAEGVQ